MMKLQQEIARQMQRRTFLGKSAQSLGALALAALTRPEMLSAAGVSRGVISPLPLPQKAKRVVWLTMAGGPSHLETFDPKPGLTAMDGKPMPASFTKGQQLAQLQGQELVCFGPQVKFKKFGKSGAEISELFPHIGSVADDICIVRSMTTDAINHDPAHMFMNTGSQIAGRPSMGAWVTYGLGSEAADLPGFVVMVPKGLPVAGADNWQAAFLPGSYQGTYLETQDRDPASLIEHLRTGDSGSAAQRAQLDLAAALNRKHLAGREDPGLEARIHSFETAFRMQAAATDAFDMQSRARARAGNVRRHRAGAADADRAAPRRARRAFRAGLARHAPTLGQPR